MYGTPTADQGITSWKFLNRLYEVNGTKKAFDGVAIHPYATGLDGIKYQFRRIRDVMRAHGDGQAFTWVTETGWSSDDFDAVGRLGVGLDGQATLLHKSFELLLDRQSAWKVSGINWFTWRDQAPGAAICRWCVSAGLVTVDGTPKPALSAFTSFTGGY
jgi:hypothetical protein